MIYIVIILVVLIFFAYFIFKFFNVKRLGYIINSQQVMSEKAHAIKELKLAFNNNEVKNVFMSEIEFSNISLRKINSSDFSHKSPLKIKCTGNFLLSEDPNEYLTPENQAAGVSLSSLNPRSLVLEFNCLKRFDQIRLVLIHNGDISINGRIKKGRIIKIKEDSFDNFYINLFFAFTVITTMILLFLGAEELEAKKTATILLFCFVYFIATFILLLYMVYKRNKKRSMRQI